MPQCPRTARPATPAARSWLRREVLPPMATQAEATNAERSGQVPRTQAVNAAENSAGLIRFIRISQRMGDAAHATRVADGGKMLQQDGQTGFAQKIVGRGHGRRLRTGKANGNR